MQGARSRPKPSSSVKEPAKVVRLAEAVGNNNNSGGGGKSGRKEIAERLKSAREAAGFDSAASFAREYGVNYSLYYSHEAGHRWISRSTEARYAKWLKVPVGSILGASGSPKWLPAKALVRIVGTIGGAMARATQMITGELPGGDVEVDLSVLVAHLVIGNELLPVYRDGDKVLHRPLDPEHFSKIRAHGNECVCRIANGGGNDIVRLLTLQPNGLWTLTLWQAPPTFDAQVIAAEPIEVVIRSYRR